MCEGDGDEREENSTCEILKNNKWMIVVFWPFDPAQNTIQDDTPEGSDTFQWQLGEEIAWVEIGWWNGTS